MPVRSTKKRKVYHFIHKIDEVIETNIEGFRYENSDGWLKIEKNGKIIIKASNERGYAWDGCTPKVEFFDLVFGAPDGRMDFSTGKPMTYYASMVHDILYQFKKEVPISRKDADVLFKEILKEAKFKPWPIFYFLVRLFGGIFGKWKNKKSTFNLKIQECSWIEREKIVLQNFKNTD